MATLTWNKTDEQTINDAFAVYLQTQLRAANAAKSQVVKDAYTATAEQVKATNFKVNEILKTVK